jgi:HAMP domain-containing protein
VISTTVYVGDIGMAFRQRVGDILVSLSVLVLLSIGISLLLARSIQRPLAALTGRMEKLASGAVDIDITEAARQAEIGKPAPQRRRCSAPLMNDPAMQDSSNRMCRSSSQEFEWRDRPESLVRCPGTTEARGDA